MFDNTEHVIYQEVKGTDKSENSDGISWYKNKRPKTIIFLEIIINDSSLVYYALKKCVVSRHALELEMIAASFERVKFLQSWLIYKRTLQTLVHGAFTRV